MTDPTEDIIIDLRRAVENLNRRIKTLENANTPSFNNTEATTSPLITNDADEGYSVGSHWLNVTTDIAYLCLDSTVGDAVWLPAASGGFGLRTLVKNSAYTFVVGDFAVIGDATSASFDVTLPTSASSFDFDNNIGTIYQLKKINVNANTVTFRGAGAELIDGANAQVLLFQYDQITVQANGVGWDVVL